MEDGLKEVRRKENRKKEVEPNRLSARSVIN